MIRVYRLGKLVAGDHPGRLSSYGDDYAVFAEGFANGLFFTETDLAEFRCRLFHDSRCVLYRGHAACPRGGPVSAEAAVSERDFHERI